MASLQWWGTIYLYPEQGIQVEPRGKEENERREEVEEREPKGGNRE